MVTDRDTYAATVCGLIEYFGGVHLARILNVPMEDLQRWATGKGRPPTHVFFRMLNLRER
jgi:hypothetical protein